MVGADVDEDGIDRVGLPFTDIGLETLVLAEPELDAEVLVLKPLELLADEIAPDVETNAEVDLLLALQLKVDMLMLKLVLKLRPDVLQLELGVDAEVEDSEGRLMLPLPSSEVLVDDAGTVMVVVYDPV